MITTAELHDAAHREGLRFDQVEKDYVILCVLSALVRAGMQDADWTFKGGTCLRHCYYPGYRFSEDIDFSCRPGDDNVVDAVRLLEAAAGLVSDDTGMAIDVRAAAQSPGQEQLEIPLHYARGGARRQALPAVRVHLTFDEPVLSGAESRTVLPIYSGLESFQLNAHSLLEIAAEKLRALLQQQEKWPRPRDLYDLWFILCERSEPMDGTQLQALFERKCEVRGVRPDVSLLTSAALKEWNRAAWTTQLVPMVKAAPDYDRVWADWVRTWAALLQRPGLTRITHAVVSSAADHHVRDEHPRRLTMPAPWTAGRDESGRPPRHWKTPWLDRVSHIVNAAIIMVPG